MTRPALLTPPRMPSPASQRAEERAPTSAAERGTSQPEPGPDPDAQPEPNSDPDPDPAPTPGVHPPRRRGWRADAPASEAGDHEPDADPNADDDARDGSPDGPQDDARSLTPPQEWPWLQRGDGNGVDKHPVDEDTGLVMYVGEDRALDYGTVVNLVNRFADALEKDGRTFPEAQKRLLLRRIRDEGGDDTFGLPLEAQLRIILTTLTEFGYDQAYAERRLAHALRNLGYPPPT